MVRNNKQALAAKSEPLHLHSGSGHSEGFARAYNMGKERVAAVHYSCNGVLLMFSELYFGVHSDKLDMASVVFTRASGVKSLVIQLRQPVTPLRILPHPILKSIFY